MDTLNIALVQPDIKWNNVKENIEKYNSFLSEISGSTDLALFPEMCLTGFNLRPYHISDKDIELQYQWIKEAVKKYNTAIAGSFIYKHDNKNYLNQYLHQNTDGSTYNYKKRHLFTPGGEHLCYKPGTDPGQIKIKNWELKACICYDLRFPVWLRNTTGYHLLICVANWPAIRHDAWEILLKARAIENQCYVAGINRTGKDKNKIDYIGGTQIIDYKGKVIDSLDNKEGIIEASLNMQELLNFRKEFPVLKDRDKFEII